MLTFYCLFRCSFLIFRIFFVFFLFFSYICFLWDGFIFYMHLLFPGLFPLHFLVPVLFKTAALWWGGREKKSPNTSHSPFAKHAQLSYFSLLKSSRFPSFLSDVTSLICLYLLCGWLERNKHWKCVGASALCLYKSGRNAFSWRGCEVFSGWISAGLAILICKTMWFFTQKCLNSGDVSAFSKREKKAKSDRWQCWSV